MIQKDLLKGTLSTIILTLLKERGRMYGYEITRSVKERTDGKIVLKEGSLYPALHKLLSDGLVFTEEEMVGNRTRIYYQLTSLGEQRIKTQVVELISFLDTIQQLVLNNKPLVHG
ncbi:MAG: PadR family transcriptional regulator [Flavobacteriales bacterium]